MNLSLMDADVVYHLRPKPVGTRLLEVFCKVRDPDPAGQVFSLPAWIPGSYMIRDFARHVVTIEARAHGEAVSLRKLDKSTWKAAPAIGELVVRAEIFANDLSVRGACLDPSGAFFNGSSIFLRVHGRESGRCVVHVSPGEDPVTSTWQVATTLSRLTGSEWEYGAFESSDYEELIDHPVLIGDLTQVTFDVNGVSHAIVLAGRHNADLGRLSADLRRICAWHAGLFQGALPMSRYLFLVRVTGVAFGGLEHRSSTALVCHRRDLPHVAESNSTAAYRRFLGLASHEYFHLWNGKRIRPTELLQPDLARETYTRQLWIVEGITSYYDDLALLRSGVISVGDYLEALGRTLTSVYRSTGRRRQTLEEASFDAWIKHYRPDENSPNAHVSYYCKGAMAALALDLEMRLRTEGRASLDDVMRVLWRNYGRDSGHGLPEGMFEELVEEVTGLDFTDFFHQALRTTVDSPVGILLAQFGVRLSLRAAANSAEHASTKGGPGGLPQSWIGMRTRKQLGALRVTHVLDDGPAQAAGVIADDEIIAIDGIRVGAETFDEMVGRLQVGEPVRFHLFRRDELLHLDIAPSEAPRDTCFLSIDDDASEEAQERRRRWLGCEPG